MKLCPHSPEVETPMEGDTIDYDCNCILCKPQVTKKNQICGCGVWLEEGEFMCRDCRKMVEQERIANANL